MLIEFLQAAFLGTLQGITEFLPISSTGHLIVAENLLGISQVTFGLTFDAALHLGTMIALFLHFGKDIGRIFTTWAKSVIHEVRLPRGSRTSDTVSAMPGWLIIFGILPVVILGLLLEGVIGTAFRSVRLVAWNLVLFSAIFFIAERLGKKSRGMENMGIRDALIIGAAQAIALLPGVSRSGITIAAGLFLGLGRVAATRFSFLMAVPLFLGAGGKKLLEAWVAVEKGFLGPNDLLFFAIGFFFAVLSGYIAIGWLLRYFRERSLDTFVVYRTLIGLGILLFL